MQNSSLHLRRGIAVAALLFLLSAPLSSFAQEAPEELLPMPSAPGDIPEGLTSCFEYYRYGSVQTPITGSLATVAQGVELAFSGTIRNENPYPIPNVSVYVKIFRERTAGGQKDANGPDVVDFVRVAGPIDLKADSSAPLTFSWSVPRNAEPGTYRAATYVVASDRFNMLGLTFTDDVVGNSYAFHVVGEDEGAVRFDKTSVVVGGAPFFFASFPPRVSPSDAVDVAARVKNTTDIPFKGTLTWKLYAWDSLRPDALIDERTEPLEVHPGGSARVGFSVSDTAHAVNYLVGEFENGDSKSVIGIRFVREGVSEPRINFVGVTRYPLDENAQLFLCAHNTNDGEAENVQLQVSIQPKSIFDRVRFGSNQVSYSGGLSGALAAVTGAVRIDPASFTVIGRLMQDGKLVDEVRVQYACESYSSDCPANVWPAIIAAVCIVLLGVKILMSRKDMDTPKPLSLNQTGLPRI